MGNGWISIGKIMTNAKQEFLVFTSDLPQIKCASLFSDVKKFILKETAQQIEFSEFLDQLNFEYDSGYGRQNLFGTIWFVDGTWAYRQEYDGSEWWEYYSCPVIPNHLRG
jgi:hypothetical protein